MASHSHHHHHDDQRPRLLLRIPRPTRHLQPIRHPPSTDTPDIFCAGLLGSWLDVQRREPCPGGRFVAKRGRGRWPGKWQRVQIHRRSHRRANRPSGRGRRRAIHRRHAGPCQHDTGRHYDRALGGHRLGEWRRSVRQRRGGGNCVAYQPSRHSQHRQQRCQSRRAWRRKTARPDFSRRPRALPTASRPRPRLTPISPRSASSSTTWRARSSAASMPTMRP